MALVLIFCTSHAWAAAYRWKDASGRVIYGDLPPAGVEAERIHITKQPLIGSPPPDAGTSQATSPAAPGGEPATPSPEGTREQGSTGERGRSGGTGGGASGTARTNTDEASERARRRQVAAQQRHDCMQALSGLLRQPGQRPSSRGDLVNSLRENCK